MKLPKSYDRAVCHDGWSVSIQASEMNYCSPRNNRGPYFSVELGMPSDTEELILKWAEDPDDPMRTVYGWVPAFVVLQVLQKHGGWVAGEIPPMVLAGWKDEDG